MVKTALFGLGQAAEDIHLPACQAVKEIEIIAACDPVAERRAAMQAQFDLPATYPNAEKLLQQERPELVIVGGPPASHFELCCLALETGAHVLCEKPFMCTLDEADRVIELARAQTRLLAVNNEYRYMNTYRQVKERLAGGEFGRLYYVQVWQQMFHPPNIDSTPWRSQLRRSTLFEFGSHPLDLLVFFFEDFPELISAAIPQPRPEYKADVLVHLTLQFPGGRLATLSFNRISHAPERYMEMRLDCEDASLRLSLGGLARASLSLDRYRGQSRPSARFSFVKGGEARSEVGGRSQVIAREPRLAYATATARHLRELLAALTHPQPDLARAEHAREILRLIFTGYEAAEKRAVLPFRTQVANG